ncbi:FTR1 family protein [Pelosinus sp. UFO1]|uniref:FTR1 family iron permease n=1 Tax=Pelosinus sp. UFO1 TaxID=484770 RepID=UPI0005701BB5|nr:FTR1 family protein [Pelosinus sp. UFO1]
MRKWLLVFCAIIVLTIGQGLALAAPQWNAVVDRIEQTMNQSLVVHKSGDTVTAKKMVNDAYYGTYEKDGLEKAVNSTVSAKRANLTEYKFSTIKKLMTNQAPEAQIKKQIDELIAMMREDVGQMSSGGKQHDSWATFWPAFLILVREGVEAILVIAAIIAYLIKSGNGEKTRIIYNYSAGAVVASFVTAILFRSAISISGASQEIMEGVTMWLAVFVLFSVSHWMRSKSDEKSWGNYIEGKVKSSLSSGNTLSLGVASFLAVYREGAELVLFYQALFNDAGDDMHMIWLGFGLGCIALVAIFALIRYGSLKMPIKPFFQGTSILMCVMALSFAGTGVSKLQEGGIVDVTLINGMPMFDLLGIYPTLETLLPQILLLTMIIGNVMYQKRKKLKEVVS